MRFSKWYEHPLWRQKKEQIAKRDGRCCCRCGEPAVQCHHLIYVRGRLPWDYPDECLISVCVACHETLTHRQRMGRYRLKRHSKRQWWADRK